MSGRARAERRSLGLPAAARGQHPPSPGRAVLTSLGLGSLLPRYRAHLPGGSHGPRPPPPAHGRHRRGESAQQAPGEDRARWAALPAPRPLRGLPVPPCETGAAGQSVLPALPDPAPRPCGRGCPQGSLCPLSVLRPVPWVSRGRDSTLEPHGRSRATWAGVSPPLTGLIAELCAADGGGPQWPCQRLVVSWLGSPADAGGQGRAGSGLPPSLALEDSREATGFRRPISSPLHQASTPTTPTMRRPTRRASALCPTWPTWWVTRTSLTSSSRYRVRGGRVAGARGTGRPPRGA